MITLARIEPDGTVSDVIVAPPPSSGLDPLAFARAVRGGVWTWGEGLDGSRAAIGRAYDPRTHRFQELAS